MNNPSDPETSYRKEIIGDAGKALKPEGSGGGPEQMKPGLGQPAQPIGSVYMPTALKGEAGYRPEVIGDARQVAGTTGSGSSLMPDAHPSPSPTPEPPIPTPTPTPPSPGK